MEKLCFLDILLLFKLDRGPISFNPVENAFATPQLAFLDTSVLAHYYSGMRRHHNFEMWPTSLGLSILGFFFRLSFFSFSFLFAAVIDVLLGSLAVKKLLRKRPRDGQFLVWG